MSQLGRREGIRVPGMPEAISHFSDVVRDLDIRHPPAHISSRSPKEDRRAMPAHEGHRVRIAVVGAVTPGEGRVVEANGRTLALFNVDGQYFALDNSCPHRGGPLGEGDLEGRTVTCPWHGWRWDVATGANVNNPAVKVGCLPVSVDGDAIFVELP